MALTIEKGVPIAPKNEGKGVGMAETLRLLEVGDSFVLPASKRSSVVSAAHRLGVKIATRKIPGTQDIRVWRVDEGD